MLIVPTTKHPYAPLSPIDAGLLEQVGYLGTVKARLSAGESPQPI